MSVIGTVERYHDAMTVGEYMMQPIYPSLTLHGRRENRSDQSKIGGYDGSLPAIRGIIGDALYDTLLRLSELDIQLWVNASNELDYRIRHVPNFETRLKDFYHRCDMPKAKMTSTQ